LSLNPNGKYSVPSGYRVYVKGAKNPLAIGADIANGSKHFSLTSTKTGDLSTGVSAQSADVNVGAGVAYSWSVESGGKDYDAHKLSVDILDAWDKWIGSHMPGS
jgi:hypothetical protein